MFQFAWWQVFIVLPLPLVSYLLLRPVPTDLQSALRIPFLGKIRGLSGKPAAGKGSGVIKNGLILMAWIMLVIAAARPQLVGEPQRLTLTGRDLLMAIDLSGSMAENDFVYKKVPINRLVAVKIVALEFIERRKTDRIGLILFGTKAYLQAPLTFDHETISILLDEAQIGFAGESTAIGDAIGLTIKQVTQQPQDSRVLILLTDGANTDGLLDPVKAAELAKEVNLKIYTIGIGADTLVKRSIFGKVTVNPSMDLDEDTLTKIANITGGQYFRARNVDELNKIYELINELEPHPEEAESIRPYKDIFFWPLSICFICLALSLAQSIVRTSFNLSRGS